MKRFLTLASVLFTLLVVSCSTRPDCTIREVAPGVFEPYGNCNNCAQISIMGYNGTERQMNMNQVSNYIHAYPPAAYSGHNSGLSDLLLYHVLFNGSSASYYQHVYAPRYNTYVSYSRSHPSAPVTKRYSGSSWSSGLFSRKNKSYSPSSGFSRSKSSSSGSWYTPSSGFSRSSRPAYSSGSSSSSSRSRSYGSSSGFGRSRSSGSSYRSSGGFRSSRR